MSGSRSLAQRVVMRKSPFRTLRSKFILGFIVACLIAVGNIGVVKSLLQQSDTIAATVNIAGKMRMLGQRIGFLLLATQHPAGSPYQSESGLNTDLQAYKTDFEHALDVLRKGGHAFGLHIPAVTGDAQHRLNHVETS